MSATAARNNALWCDAVCRAHGRPGAFTADMWLNAHGTPRYYPDAVTLREGADIAPLLALPRPGRSVKDSFACLDLEPYGFVRLFDATWIAAPAPSLGGDETGPRVFLPSLLDDPDIAFLAWMHGDSLVGGGILNRGAGVVGLSNSFVCGMDARQVRRGLLVAAGRLFPGLDVVGYARGDPLVAALDCGFVPVGPLAVWVAQPA